MSRDDEDARNSTLTVTPDALAWRGRFTIRNRDIDINVKASKSRKACPVVLEVATLMPDLLCLEMLPLVDVWPKYLNVVPPTEFTIDLFFVSEGRDNGELDGLLADVTSTDSALKAVIRGGFELLIFSSLQLPEKLQRLDGKVYFWGLFMGQSASFSSSHKPHSDVEVQNNEGTLALCYDSSNSRSFEVETSPVYDLDELRGLKSTDQVKRRGRQLDEAWTHAEPLDFLKQKTKCKYCGFISDHGGISRMKAHLSGEIPELQVCDKVSPEVRKSMADWYNKWVVNTKALWVAGYKDSYPSNRRSFDVEKSQVYIHDEPRAKNSVDITRKKQGRPFDAAWAHAEPLDQLKLTTRCNYCGFISETGGISRLKVHLSGESPRVPACLKVPQELKDDMAGWFHRWVKTTKAVWMMESQGNSEQASQRPLGEVWEHVILRLDENGEHIKCKHCNFVSKHGGMDHMIVHLAGGDPEMQLEGCPYVPPGFKSLIFEQLYNSNHMMTAGTEELQQVFERTDEAEWTDNDTSLMDVVVISP